MIIQLNITALASNHRLHTVYTYAYTPMGVRATGYRGVHKDSRIYNSMQSDTKSEPLLP